MAKLNKEEARDAAYMVVYSLIGPAHSFGCLCAWPARRVLEHGYPHTRFQPSECVWLVPGTVNPEVF